MATSEDAVSLLGGESVNFLTDDDVFFEQSVGSWSATNASLAVERTRVFRDVYQTMRVQPLTVGSPYTLVEVTHDAQIVGPSYVNDSIVGTVFVYAYTPLRIGIRINSSLPDETSVTYVNIPSLTWTLVRSAELNVPANFLNLSYSMTVLAESEGGLQHFHLAHPVLTNYYGFTQNGFVRETTFFIPRVLTEVDSEQTDPPYPMYRFMDIGLAYADTALQQSLNFRYRDISEGFEEADDTTKSTLVNPDVADPKYLPWLAQFVGMRLPLIIGGETPWGNLPATWEAVMEDIDDTPDVTYSISSISRDGSGTVTAVLTSSPLDLEIGETVSVRDTALLDGQFVLTAVETGTNTIEWEQDGAATSDSVGSVTVVDTSWGEIESFNTADSQFVPRRRELISQARLGHRSGTIGSVENAAKVGLTGTKAVQVIVEPIETPWLIFVYTLTSETPGGVTGLASPDIELRLSEVRPMGFQVIHECVDSL